MARRFAKRVLFLLFSLCIVMSSLPALSAMVYIPHMTSGSGNWNDYLLVDNTGDETAPFTLTLGHGDDSGKRQFQRLQSVNKHDTPTR